MLLSFPTINIAYPPKFPINANGIIKEVICQVCSKVNADGSLFQSCCIDGAV